MGKEELINSLTYNNMPMENEAVDVTWQYVAPFAVGLGKTLNKGLNYIKDYAPYINDIWQGRNLLLHKDFNKMTPKEYTNYGNTGKEFFKRILHPQKANNEIVGEIIFPNGSAGKSDYKYMEQYPLLRYNINKAKDNKFIKNYKNRKDTDGFNNLKVKWKDKDYTYQIKNNKYDKTNDFYNIKPYDLL